MSSIKAQTFVGIMWGGLEKFSLQLFGFIQGVILARLLSPSDYGLIAMVGIFVSLSYTFVDAGFGTALVQKKNKTEKDYSTVFVLNVCLSFIIGCVLFACGGIVANFYKEPLLVSIIHVYAAIIFLSSLIAIQDVRLTIFLEFKKKSTINIVTTVVSGLFSILLAFCGYGVWSLVVPQFLTLLLKSFLYWHFQHWLPKLSFSSQSCKQLFGFGSKILASSILATIFDNIYSLIIGKFFSARTLGYYSKGESYANLPPKTITGIIESVSYPVLSRLQDNDETIIGAFRRMLRTASYIIFPIMAWILVLAKPLVIVLITEKWLPCVIFLQILCVAKMWWHVHVLNLTLLKAKGRSDLFFNLEVIKKVMEIIVLVVTVPLGIMAMCYGAVASSLISMFINSFYTGRILSFGIWKQLKEMFPSLLYSCVMGLAISLLTLFVESVHLKLLVGSATAVVVYFGVSYLTKSVDLTYLLGLVKGATSHRIAHQ